MPVASLLRTFVDFDLNELFIDDNTILIRPRDRALSDSDKAKISSIVRKALNDFTVTSERDSELAERVKQKLKEIKFNLKASDGIRAAVPAPDYLIESHTGPAGAGSGVIRSDPDGFEGLNLDNRPPELLSLIQEKYNFLHGTSIYQIRAYQCLGNISILPPLSFVTDIAENYSLDIFQLIKSQILSLGSRASSKKPDFYFIDIGSGVGALSLNLINRIDEDDEIVRFSTKMHFINLSLNNNRYPEKEDSKCILTYFNDIDANNLISGLGSKSLHLQNQVDFIFSSMCFCHLADPLGTFTQAYDLLSENGIMILDCFELFIDSIEIASFNVLIDILKMNEIPFLILLGGDIIIKKPSIKRPLIPYQYDGIFQTRSRVKYSNYKKLEMSSMRPATPAHQTYSLLEFLIKNNLFSTDDYSNSLYQTKTETTTLRENAIKPYLKLLHREFPEAKRIIREAFSKSPIERLD